ncbi:MAG: hypothetical protein Q9165_005668 [Trypethelium subeluteriae]
MAYEEEDRWLNNWYITFCPQYFQNSYALEMDDFINKINHSGYDMTVMEKFSSIPWSRAEIFFHETMHMSKIVTSPKARDYAYRAQDVYTLAKKNNTQLAMANADSWSITALAIWAQKTFNLASPPSPYSAHTPLPSAFQPTYDDSRPYDILYVDAGDVVPQGASPVPQGSPYFVDTNLWDIIPPKTPDPASGTSSTPPPTMTTMASSSAAAPSCIDDQVEGSCTQGTYPSLGPDSGAQPPICDKADGSGTWPRLNNASASSAAATYCSELISSSTVLNPTAAPPQPAIVGNGAAENNGHLAVAVIYDNSSCPQDGSNGELDFAGLGQEECEADLFEAINAMCAQDPSWPSYNPDFTLEGGVYLADCGLWSLTGQP